jgi:hypothetical protein
MATLDDKVLKLEARIERLETLIHQIMSIPHRGDLPEAGATLSQDQLLDLLHAQGFVRDPTVEEQRLADAWEALPAEEKQAHIHLMQRLPLTPWLSQILIENRR